MSHVLTEAVRGAAARFGDRVAFADEHDRTLTYAELDRVSAEVASGLAAVGVQAGDVVATALPSSIEHVLVYVGTARIGAVTAAVNPRLPARHREELLALVDPVLTLASRDEVQELTAMGDGPPPEPPDDPSRPVVIVFTSGTTGTPKGAVFTDRQLRAVRVMDTGDRWGDPGEEPRHQIAATELAHIGFATKLPWYLRLGLTTHLLERWRASDVLDLIERHRVEVAGGIAPQIALMLRDERFNQRDLSCVRTVIGAGAASPPALIRAAIERFDATYSVRYSSTESGGLGTVLDVTDPEDRAALRSVGHARPEVALQIRDEDGRPVAVEQTGEVWLASPAVMEGYWAAPEETAEVLQDGWLRTGDRGHLDHEGRLVLEGRGSEMYIRGGYNVFPARVEAVLREHPLVADVAVVPRADDVMGQVGVAVVVPVAPSFPPGLARLRDELSDRLAQHELPEDLVVVEALPLTPMHKVDRAALRDVVA